ncbi:MAG: two-component system response regulator CreB [Betaproteobacteria bacterium]|nr:MAG: two-component system response regulator CreB [Betaproteobacteria bacterium]
MNSPNADAVSVLIVEDEIAIAETLLYALATAGIAAQHATTLTAARAVLLTLPQLVILDLGLPDGSGLDLCREIRRGDFSASELPILMLTAMSDEVDRIVGLELGADDYVTKPFSPREVVLRVKTILRRAQSVPNGATPLAEPTQRFEFDAAGQRFRYANQWLDLTRRELHLLQLLLQSPGRIYSRETLLDRVWGRDAESMERTVDTHIKTLRAKLRNADPSIDVVVTHRGLGYSVVL